MHRRKCLQLLQIFALSLVLLSIVLIACLHSNHLGSNSRAVPWDTTLKRSISDSVPEHEQCIGPKLKIGFAKTHKTASRWAMQDLWFELLISCHLFQHNSKCVSSPRSRARGGILARYELVFGYVEIHSVFFIRDTVKCWLVVSHKFSLHID